MAADNNTLLVAVLAIGGLVAVFITSKEKEEPKKTAFNSPDAPAPGAPIAKNVPKKEDVALIPDEAKSIMTHIEDTAKYMQQQFNDMQGFFENPEYKCSTFSDMKERFPIQLKKFMELRAFLINANTEFMGMRDKLANRFHQGSWIAANSGWFDLPDKLLIKLGQYGMTFKIMEQVPKGPGNPDGAPMDVEGATVLSPGEAHNAKTSMAAARAPNPDQENLMRATALLRGRAKSRKGTTPSSHTRRCPHKPRWISERNGSGRPRCRRRSCPSPRSEPRRWQRHSQHNRTPSTPRTPMVAARGASGTWPTR